MKNIIQRDIILNGDSGGESKPTILYQAMYNSSIHESAYSVISLHRNKENAESAIKKHMEGEYEKYLEYKKWCEEDDPEFFSEHPPVFAQHEGWTVQPIELID